MVDRAKSLIGERVLHLIQKRGTNEFQVSKQAGLGDSYVRDLIRKPGINPKVQNLQKVAEVLQTTIEYLTGLTDVEDAGEPVRIPIERYDPAAADPAEGADEQAFTSSVTGVTGIPKGTIAEIFGEGGMGGGGLTTVLEGVTVAGGMTFAGEQIRDYWRVPPHALTAFGITNEGSIVIRAKGDSMYPTIADGDFVVLNTRHKSPSPPGIYALLDAFGEVIIKRLEVVSEPKDEIQRVQIKSDNPRYEVRERDADDVRVLGRVVLRMGKPA